LNVTGQVDLDTTLPGVVLNGTSTAVAIGRQFRIINNDNTDNVTGTFAGAPEGAIVLVGGVSYGITYFGGTGNDVVLSRLGRFDFNATNNPNLPITDTTNGYQQVLATASNPVTGGNGFGWSGGTLAVLDRGVDGLGYPGPLLRDLHYQSNARTFSVDVVPGRTYQVTLISGDRSRHHDRIRVSLESVVMADELTGQTELSNVANQWNSARYTPWRLWTVC